MADKPKKKVSGAEIDAMRDTVIDELLTLSDQQVDTDLLPRLTALKGRDSKEIQNELLGILDDAAYMALASDFVMNILHHLWLAAGGDLSKHEDRLRPENFDDSVEKYGWQRGTES